jgi:hypothetical protein
VDERQQYIERLGRLPAAIADFDDFRGFFPHILEHRLRLLWGIAYLSPGIARAISAPPLLVAGHERWLDWEPRQRHMSICGGTPSIYTYAKHDCRTLAAHHARDRWGSALIHREAIESTAVIELVDPTVEHVYVALRKGAAGRRFSSWLDDLTAEVLVATVDVIAGDELQAATGGKLPELFLHCGSCGGWFCDKNGGTCFCCGAPRAQPKPTGLFASAILPGPVYDLLQSLGRRFTLTRHQLEQKAFAASAAALAIGAVAEANLAIAAELEKIADPALRAAVEAGLARPSYHRPATVPASRVRARSLVIDDHQD